jgi:hypothetical protein
MNPARNSSTRLFTAGLMKVVFTSSSFYNVLELPNQGGLDCEIRHDGFARAGCDGCGHEYLLLFFLFPQVSLFDLLVFKQGRRFIG